MYTYAWYHWLTFFYLYCFFGWIFESAYVSLRKRRFVNRGFLHLPMLPLYGTGAVMMLWVSLPVKDNLFLVYCFGVVAATALEYVTGAAMERLFKIKYWDYSDQRFQLNGYICLSSSVAWGFLTILMTEVIHRPVERLVLHMVPFAEWALLIAISILFAADTVKSTREALDLARALEAVTKLRSELEELQAQISDLRTEAAQNFEARLEAREEKIRNFCETQGERVAAFRENQEERFSAFRENQEERLAAFRENQEERLSAFRENQEERLTSFRENQGELLASFRESREAAIQELGTRFAEKSAALQQHLDTYRSGILDRNPSASSRFFTSAMKELKAFANEQKSRRQSR